MHISKMSRSCSAQIQPNRVDEKIFDRGDERQGSSISVSLLLSSTEARADHLVGREVDGATSSAGMKRRRDGKRGN